MPPFCASRFPSQNKVSWHLSSYKIFLISQEQEPRPIFKTRAWPKLSISKNYRDIVLWSHYFIKPLFYKPLENGFETPLRKLYKGDVYVSICFWKYLPKPYSFPWSSLQLHHGILIFEHLLRPCSYDVAAWFLTMIDYIWLCLTSFCVHDRFAWRDFL
jgi:hypothetical protein